MRVGHCFGDWLGLLEDRCDMIFKQKSTASRKKAKLDLALALLTRIQALFSVTDLLPWFPSMISCGGSCPMRSRLLCFLFKRQRVQLPCEMTLPRPRIDLDNHTTATRP